MLLATAEWRAPVMKIDPDVELAARAIFCLQLLPWNASIASAMAAQNQAATDALSKSW
jgi:hypothetical protein